MVKGAGSVDVMRVEVRGLDIGKIQRTTDIIRGLISEMPGVSVPMIVDQGPDSDLLRMELKKIEKISRLVVLFSEKDNPGRGWRDVTDVFMPLRVTERMPANKLVREVINQNTELTFMSFLTALRGVDPKGMLAIEANFRSQDNPELKKLVCAAVVLINRIFASADAMDQEMMKLNPGILIKKLNENGIDLQAFRVEKGVLVMSMEKLAQQFANREEVEKAA